MSFLQTHLHTSSRKRKLELFVILQGEYFTRRVQFFKFLIRLVKSDRLFDQRGESVLLCLSLRFFGLKVFCFVLFLVLSSDFVDLEFRAQNTNH